MNKQILALKAEQEDADIKSKQIQRDLLLTFNKQQHLAEQLEKSVCEYLTDSPVEVFTSTPAFELVCESLTISPEHCVNAKFTQSLNQANAFIEASPKIIMTNPDTSLMGIPFNTVIPKRTASAIVREHAQMYGRIMATYQASFPHFESVVTGVAIDNDELQEEEFSAITVKIVYGRPAILFYSNHGHDAQQKLFNTWVELLSAVRELSQ